MNKYQDTIAKQKPDQEVLWDAIEAFRRETNLKMDEVQVAGITMGKEVDAIIRLQVEGRAIEFWVEIKPTVTNTLVGRLAHQFEEQPRQWLVATRYISHQLARKMRDLGIQFMDTVGNAYINEPSIFIFTYGNKPKQPLRKAAEEVMLGRAGLHVIFALMCKPELENATYRNIAQGARVALGTVAGVMKELNQHGFLIEMPTGERRLNQKKNLLDKWITAYVERLRQKKLIGRYTANKPNFWLDTDLYHFDAQWGGEVAANKMLHYLKPETIVIYARKPVNELVLQLKLRKDERGNVELRERFWEFENNGPDKDLVPPLLVYADLLATADTRNVETAKLIYDEYLKRYLG